jgi:hypothetical protein
MPRMTISIGKPYADTLVQQAAAERRDPREHAAYILERVLREKPTVEQQTNQQAGA